MSEPELVDDDVVGRAFRRSIIVIIVLSVAAVVFFLTQPTDVTEIAQEASQTVLPQVRELPALEIPQLEFADITIDAGITFVHENGAEGEKLLPETMGGGGAFLDFDNDGDQDILCVNSTVWPWAEQQPANRPTSALYENDGRGHYTDVTAGSGLDVSFYGNGVACGDYDNDGKVDLYITAVGTNRLFHNDGEGRFTDVTDQSQVGGRAQAWSTSAGWFDYDQDGDLDLFVCNYVDWSREKDLQMGFTLDGTLRAYGRPNEFSGTFPVLYRNEGGGRFQDVSEVAGIRIQDPNTQEPLAKSLGLTFCDANGDHWLDVVIANDTVQNLLLLNQKDGTFSENAMSSGVAFDNQGNARGAMGIAAGYFRNSDAIGISIGNFANEMTALYVCQTPGSPLPLFRDEAVSNGIGPVTRVELTFGVLFLDADLDGRLDIFGCNGHLEEDIQKVQSSQHYAQPPQLLWNCGAMYDNEFMVVPNEKLSDEFTRPMVGRGASQADIDGDGDLDLLLLSSGGNVRLLQNNQKTGNHWLRLSLQGTSSNRDAIGSVAHLTLSNGSTMTRVVMPTCSYQSQIELPVTFGLGECDSITQLTITWPNGTVQTVDPPAVDTMLEIHEPQTD